MTAKVKKKASNGTLTLAVLCVATLLILPNINRNFLWQDEAQTALISRSILSSYVPKISDSTNSFSQELGAEAGPDGVYKWHPWLPFYVHAAFFGLFGESDFVARFPDALFGIGTVLICMWIVLSTGGNRRDALIAVFTLLLMIPFLILARQCRYYSMITFFSSAGIWSYFQLIQSKKRAEIYLTVSTILLFHTQLVFGFIFFLAVTMHSLLMGKKMVKRLWVPAMGLIYGVIPWLIYIFDISYRSIYGQTFLNIGSAILRIGEYAVLLEKYIIPFYLLLVILLILLYNRKKALALWNKKKKFAGFLLLYLALEVVIISLVAPFHFFRYLAPVLPVCALLLAELTEFGFQSRIIFGVACIAAFLINQPLVKYYYELTEGFKGPMEGVVPYLQKYSEPKDLVAITYEDLPVKWYTGLHVLGGLTGERPEEAVQARWIILRKHIIFEKDAFVSYYLRKNVAWEKYKRIALPFPDTAYENREEPQTHLYRTVAIEDSVVIYERVR